MDNEDGSYEEDVAEYEEEQLELNLEEDNDDSKRKCKFHRQCDRELALRKFY